MEAVRSSSAPVGNFESTALRAPLILDAVRGQKHPSRGVGKGATGKPRGVLHGEPKMSCRIVKSFLHGIEQMIAHFKALSTLFRLSKTFGAIRRDFRAAWAQIALSSLHHPSLIKAPSDLCNTFKGICMHIYNTCTLKSLYQWL